MGQTLQSLGKNQCFHHFSSYEKNWFAKYVDPVKKQWKSVSSSYKKPLKITVFQKMNIFHKQNIKLGSPSCVEHKYVYIW